MVTRARSISPGWLLLLSFGAALALGCARTTGSPPGGPSPPRPVDGNVFEACDTGCLRPSDCAYAYVDNGVCPAGFRCARQFACSVDAAVDR